ACVNAGGGEWWPRHRSRCGTDNCLRRGRAEALKAAAAGTCPGGRRCIPARLRAAARHGAAKLIPMPRYKLIIEYDGSGLVGWQRQANGLSVQEILETAAERFCGEHLTVHGAGRTDAGVHA